MYMGGYWLAGRYQQHAIKKEMRRRIRATVPASETTRFEFPLHNGQPAVASFAWIDKHEFRYNGELYDVVEKKIINGRLYLTCINDTKEKILIKKFTDIARKQNNEPAKSASSIQVFLSLVFIQPGRIIITSPSSVISSPVDRYLPFFSKVSRDVITPPPQV